MATEKLSSVEGLHEPATPLSTSSFSRLDHDSAEPSAVELPDIGDIHGKTKITEESVWEYFIDYMSVAHEADALTYAKTRKEALEHFIGVDRHSLLTEIWLIEAERLIFGGRIINARAKKLASSPGAKILTISTWKITEQQNWVLALDYPEAQVESYRAECGWPSSIIRSNKHVGPDNYHSFVGETLSSLPYPDNSFDVLSIYMCWFLIHDREKTRQFFSECRRVLKPGGVLELPCKIAETFLSDSVLSDIIENLLDEYDAHYFDERINLGCREGGFKDENLASAYMGMPCGFGGEIGYISQYILLFYRMHIIQFVVQTKNLPENVVEDAIRAAMNLDPAQGREAVLPLWYIGYGEK